MTKLAWPQASKPLTTMPKQSGTANRHTSPRRLRSQPSRPRPRPCHLALHRSPHSSSKSSRLPHDPLCILIVWDKCRRMKEETIRELMGHTFEATTLNLLGRHPQAARQPPQTLASRNLDHRTPGADQGHGRLPNEDLCPRSVEDRVRLPAEGLVLHHPRPCAGSRPVRPPRHNGSISPRSRPTERQRGLRSTRSTTTNVCVR